GCDRRAAGGSRRTSDARSSRRSTTLVPALRACAALRRASLGLARRWFSRCALIALAAIAACGASRQEVEIARTARYRGDKLAMFAAARAATAERYRITLSDETTLRIETAGRWYTPDGLGASERNNAMRDVPDRSIHLRMIVRLVPRGDDWGIAIEPVMMRYFAGRPNPDLLAPDDPSLPGWAHGKVEQLSSAIHRALASYQVQEPPR
ncbi:MAG TPA: hypothetical protein VIX73_39310, partial [Kofleriaceae bacterium]